MDPIFHRTSIREYTADPLTEEQITLILRAAMAAPSACNQQPWEFYVVTDKAIIEELSRVTPFTGPCKGAPVVFVPCIRSDCRVPKMAPYDLSAAIENMLLEADQLGLGTCWMGISPMTMRMDKVSQLLNIPEELSPFALVSCGVPAHPRAQQDRFDEGRIHRI